MFALFLRYPLKCRRSQVVYTLHPSFATPTREVVALPFFDLTEHGWGEFEIAAKVSVQLRICLQSPAADEPTHFCSANLQVHFADDAGEHPIELYHKLRLYTEAETANQNTKKPVGGRPAMLAQLCYRGRHSNELCSLAVEARACSACACCICE